MPIVTVTPVIQDTINRMLSEYHLTLKLVNAVKARREPGRAPYKEMHEDQIGLIAEYRWPLVLAHHACLYLNSQEFDMDYLNFMKLFAKGSSPYHTNIYFLAQFGLQASAPLRSPQFWWQSNELEPNLTRDVKHRISTDLELGAQVLLEAVGHSWK